MPKYLCLQRGLPGAESPTQKPSPAEMQALYEQFLSARQDVHGGLLLLEEQDRSLWDREEIHVGLTWLARSAEGETFSRYHAEAGIAAEHCLAATFAETRWERIVECYALRERLAPSPLHTLNRALAMAEWQGPGPALAMLEALAPPAWLVESYLWHAALADLHRRCGHAELACSHGAAALARAPSEALRAVLARRLGSAAALAGDVKAERRDLRRSHEDERGRG